MIWCTNKLVFFPISRLLVAQSPNQNNIFHSQLLHLKAPVSMHIFLLYKTLGRRRLCKCLKQDKDQAMGTAWLNHQSIYLNANSFVAGLIKLPCRMNANTLQCVYQWLPSSLKCSCHAGISSFRVWTTICSGTNWIYEFSRRCICCVRIDL